MFLVRFIGYLFGIGAVMFLLAAGGLWAAYRYYAAELPSYEGLKTYEPPVMTRIHAADGSLIAEYAHERRMFLPIQSIPDLVKNAFLSAEDKNFYQHNGIDFGGIGRAALLAVRSGGRTVQGASTITQQVAKNFLLTNQRTMDRKIREAILAIRMEGAFTKDQILELYLNEIYLGLGAYGVAAASLLYFDKSVHELTVAEAAYLAALPKAPNNYHPFRAPERAIERRNWVIERMQENGVLDAEGAKQAMAAPLNVTPRQTGPHLFASEYFAEEVRRQLAQMHGEKGLYAGGLSVRTTLDPKLQVIARKAFMDGVIDFDRDSGYRGPVATIDPTGDWGPRLAEVKGLSDVPEWRLAVVLSVTPQEAMIGLQPGRQVSGQLSTERARGFVKLETMRWARWNSPKRRSGAPKTVADVLTPGDVIYVSKVGNGEAERDFYALQQVPAVSGALVAMDPHTGRVLASIGGFSFSESEFNRATQARRQPGSSFKPFIYAAALDNGYTPSSVVLDGPLELPQGPGLPPWRPENYSGKFYGPSTLRVGIEQSRNTMTVRLAKDMGMPLVAEYAKRFGIYDKLPPFLSASLGSQETTPLALTAAYATIANGGRYVKASFIDRIQDRYGRTIYKHDKRECPGCQATDWAKQLEPELIDNADQVLDPMTAYQITAMMEGVVQRGTATLLKDLKRPIAGKTGTTNDEKDAWFVGFTPDLAVGVYIGYDRPRPMGRGRTGGLLAAPIFKQFMAEALKDQPPVAFRVPEGLKLVAINRRTGMRSAAGDPDTIMEAFKPGTGPGDSYSIIGFDAEQFTRARKVTPDIERQLQPGGLY